MTVKCKKVVINSQGPELPRDVRLWCAGCTNNFRLVPFVHSFSPHHGSIVIGTTSA